jgi:hypothetical protein
LAEPLRTNEICCPIERMFDYDVGMAVNEMAPRAEMAVEVGVLPLERLETEICSLSSQIAAATCRLLLAVAEYDRRRGWADWECRSMVHWLAWRCGVAPVTAREQLRVAHALHRLPEVVAAFAGGELSYSQVRAVTRVATAATDGVLVEVARSMTAAQLERVVSAYRGLRAVTTETAEDRHRRRSFVSFVDDDGMRVTIVRQAPEEGARVDAAVEAEARDIAASRRGVQVGADGAGDVDDSWVARRADALSALVARGAAAGDDGASLADRSMAVVHVSIEALSAPPADTDHPVVEAAGGLCYVEGGPAIAAETARRVTCGGHQVVLVEDADGNVLGVGRRRRRASVALERAMRARDGGCMFPGCDATKGTQAHHVVHWTADGPTDLSNLLTLCSFHHHRLHEGGFTMRSGPDRRWLFVTPGGQVLPDRTALPATASLELPQACATVDWDACVPDWDGGQLDAYATDVLTQHLLTTEQAQDASRPTLVG